MSDGAVIALRAKREREFIKVLRDQAAFEPATAAHVSLESAFAARALRALIKGGAVVEASDGYYYLDEDAYETLRNRRRVRVALSFVAVAVIAALAFALGR